MSIWNHIEGPACRAIGCTSIFARWFAWPHAHVCTPITKRVFEED